MAMAIPRQSEWIILRRVYAFLKARKLNAAAYALEHEARLKLDLAHVQSSITKGRWRAADEYLSSFLGERGTRAASSTLFVVRFERLVRALKRGSLAWAAGYFHRSVKPLLRNHPDAATAHLHCFRAFVSDPESLRREHPDDYGYRRQRSARFLQHIHQNDGLDICMQDIEDDQLVRIRGTSALGLRRYAGPCRRRKPSAGSVAKAYLDRRKYLREEGGYMPFPSFTPES